MRLTAVFTALWIASALAGPSLAQEIAGAVFEDRDADGVRDPEEEPLPGVAVRLRGRADSGAAVDRVEISAADGSWTHPAGAGCYLLAPEDPPGWRFTAARADGFLEGTPGYLFPAGHPRQSKLDQAMVRLAGGTYLYAGLGDSIGRNFSLCALGQAFDYSEQVLARLRCTSPSATLTFEGAAMLGEHTDDLLVDDGLDSNNVFVMIARQPQLISLSMIGNDLLGVEPAGPPTQADVNRVAAEIIDARRNLQEALSAMVTGIPGADLVLNTLYDPEADDCASTELHRPWLPIVNRVLRDLAWGQVRRIAINEVAAEFAHEDQEGGCAGFTGMICRGPLMLDEIHPTADGYAIIREKLWEAVGGVSLGPGDALGRASRTGAAFGYLRRVRRLLPAAHRTAGGAAVEDPEAALDDRDGGAPARILLSTPGDAFLVSGFPDWYDEIRIARAVVGVRYRTTGVMDHDAYRIEASPDGEFDPGAGFEYSPTNWNFATPIVGGGGPGRPLENPDFPEARILAMPDVPAYRDVSATLTGNPILSTGAAEYAWPAPDPVDLGATVVRVAAPGQRVSPSGPGDRIELDQVWIDLYGWEMERPPEVRSLEVARRADGRLEVSFEPIPGADRYALYFGTLTALRAGAYDHGAGAPHGPICAAPTEAAGGRLRVIIDPSEPPGEDLYVLATAHVQDVESPSGTRSDGAEIDRSQSTCR